MSEQDRKDWFAGKWVAVQPTGYRNWSVRRQVKGRVEATRDLFPSEKTARKYAEKLNRRDAP